MKQAHEQRNKDGVLVSYTYQFVPFSSRQLCWAMFESPSKAKSQVGPSIYDFASMVQVWQVGKVLDARTGMLPYKCLMLNVVVEEWTLSRLSSTYNPFFGKLTTLGVVDVPEFKDLINRTEDLLMTDTNVPPATLNANKWQLGLEEFRELEIDVESIREEIKVFLRIDEEARMQELITKKAASAEYPGPSNELVGFKAAIENIDIGFFMYAEKNFNPDESVKPDSHVSIFSKAAGLHEFKAGLDEAERKTVEIAWDVNLAIAEMKEAFELYNYLFTSYGGPDRGKRVDTWPV